jgi:hypothetical protein
MVSTKISRSRSRVRRLAPSGIWLSILRPSPAQPWQAEQFALSMNNSIPSRISAGACARAAGAAMTIMAKAAAANAAARRAFC